MSRKRTRSSKRLYRTTKPRVRIEPDGRAILAGLSYRDLRSIITAASLYNTDSYNEAKAKLADVEQEVKDEPDYPLNAIKLANAKNNVTWLEKRRWVIDAIRDSLGEAIDGIDIDSTDQRSKPWRKRLLESDSLRRLVDMIIAQASSEGETSKPVAVPEVVNDNKDSATNLAEQPLSVLLMTLFVAVLVNLFIIALFYFCPPSK